MVRKLKKYFLQQNHFTRLMHFQYNFQENEILTTESSHSRKRQIKSKNSEQYSIRNIKIDIKKEILATISSN